MLHKEAWLKLTKKVKKEEIYPLMTYAVLGRPSLMFQVKFTKDEEFIVMGNPSMGGLKLSSNFTFGKREFMAIYPLYYSQMLFDARYADIMQYAPYIFPPSPNHRKRKPTMTQTPTSEQETETPRKNNEVYNERKRNRSLHHHGYIER